MTERTPEEGVPPIPANSLPVKTGSGLALLDGLVVLDLTTSIAGPYGAQLLGDMGATVIKIERPGSGDDARAWGPPFLDGESLWFQSVNRNKRSVTLDYASERGHPVLARLVEKADVILVNLVSRAQRKLGVDHGTLSKINPTLIHVSITGFGLTGTRADKPCYDLIAEGYSGVMDMTGERENPPQKVGSPAADLLAGQDAAMAAMGAVISRGRTGKGCAIDVSMAESMTRFMAPRLLPYLGSGELLRRSGGRDSVIAIYQVFDTADEPLTLGLGNDGIWQRFWGVMGDPDYAARPEYASNPKRRTHRAAIVEKIAGLLRAQPRDYWLKRFEEAKVPAGPLQRLDQVAQDAEFHARGLLYACERDGVQIPQVGLGIAFDGASEGCAPPPRLGQDTDAILSGWLNMTEDEIRAMRSDRII